MNLSFLRRFMEETAFPREALLAVEQALSLVEAAGRAPALASVVADYGENRRTDATESALQALSAATGVHPYTLWLITLMGASQPVLSRADGKDARILWDTFTDIRYKALECHAVYGVWGVFVGYWYPIFYKGEIEKLGRLEYQKGAFRHPRPVTVAGITVNPGDPVRILHIPSSGEPFHREARLDSYRRAWRRYCPQGGVLTCVCSSWLLYPPYDQVWPEHSNIRDFAREFFPLEQTDTPQFDDGWRLFAAQWKRPAEALPEDTALRRAMKAYLTAGNPTGCGLGLLLFDGERILTRRD